MDFIEIALIGLDGEAAETVSELFNRYGHGGAVMDAYPPHFAQATVRTVIPTDDQARLRQIEMMLALIGQALPNGLPEPRYQPVGESDWANAWKEHFNVIRLGRRFVIKPSWRDYTPTNDDLVIEIDPGLAFGSGLHPTTRLCLEILEDMSPAGHSVFDVGTGSGILALVALKLGANPVRAVDIDDVAVRVTQENLARNGYPPSKSGAGIKIETAVGSAADAGGRQWQVVLANILANTLLELMPDLAAAVTPGGRLILSGLIAGQDDDVLAAASAQNMRLVERRTYEDWVALVVEK
jgi:ribosomal protein L11 methyltransferase